LELLAEQIDDPIFLDPIQKFLMNPGESADGITFPNNGIGLPPYSTSIKKPFSLFIIIRSAFKPSLHLLLWNVVWVYDIG